MIGPAAIEARMREIITADQPFLRDEVAPEAALELFADQPYKVEIIENVEAPTIRTSAREDISVGTRTPAMRA